MKGPIMKIGRSSDSWLTKHKPCLNEGADHEDRPGDPAKRIVPLTVDQPQ